MYGRDHVLPGFAGSAVQTAGVAIPPGLQFQPPQNATTDFSPASKDLFASTPRAYHVGAASDSGFQTPARASSSDCELGLVNSAPHVVNYASEFAGLNNLSLSNNGNYVSPRMLPGPNSVVGNNEPLRVSNSVCGPVQQNPSVSIVRPTAISQHSDQFSHVQSPPAPKNVFCMPSAVDCITPPRECTVNIEDSVGFNHRDSVNVFGCSTPGVVDNYGQSRNLSSNSLPAAAVHQPNIVYPSAPVDRAALPFDSSSASPAPQPPGWYSSAPVNLPAPHVTLHPSNPFRADVLAAASFESSAPDDNLNSVYCKISAHHPASSPAHRIKLPAFDPRHVETWFAVVDSVLQHNGVTDDQAKFVTIVAHLGSDCDLISDIIACPPTCDKYATVKRTIIQRLSLSPEQQLVKVIRGEVLGSQTPSELWRSLRSTTNPTVLPDATLWSLWLLKLPSHIQSSLLACEDCPVAQRLVLADRLHKVGTLNIFNDAALKSKRTDSLAPAAVPKVPARIAPTSPTANLTDTPSLCWFHTRFGD